MNNFTGWMTLHRRKDVARHFNSGILRKWAQVIGLEAVAMIKSLTIHIEILDTAARGVGEAIAERAGATFNELDGTGEEAECCRWDEKVVMQSLSLEGLGFSPASVNFKITKYQD